MAVVEPKDRRRDYRFRATLQLGFQYAGRRHMAITTEVSPRGASIVAPVRLPQGAILVFEIEQSETGPDVTGVRLIAQVNWAGPAPFGDGGSFAAGIQFLRTTGSTWHDLLKFLRKQRRAEVPGENEPGPADTRAPGSERPTARSGKIQALFNHEGAWFRSEIVTMNHSTLWLRIARIPPGRGSPARVRIAVRREGKLTAIDIRGHVPGNPIADANSAGWIFEVNIEQVSHVDLFEQLLQRLTGQSELV